MAEMNCQDFVDMQIEIDQLIRKEKELLSIIRLLLPIAERHAVTSFGQDVVRIAKSALADFKESK